MGVKRGLGIAGAIALFVSLPLVALFGFLVRGSKGDIRWGWEVGAVVLSLVAAAVPPLTADREKKNQDAIHIEEGAAVWNTLNQVIDPIVKDLALALTTDGHQRNELLERLIPACLQAAAANVGVGPEKVRTCLYRFEGLPRGAWKLLAVDSRGRDEPIGTDFQ